MSHSDSDYDDCDDPKGQGDPPPYIENAPGNTSGMPPSHSGPTTTMYTSTSTAVGASVTVMTGQPTYVAGVVYQGDMNVLPVGVNIGQAPFIGPKESPMTCPNCSHRIVTKVEYKSTMRTHMCALMFCMFGCLPCILIPYCTNSCRNADHYCPGCNAFLGTYMRV